MIKLNDILHLSNEEIAKTKFRFMVESNKFNPVEIVKDINKMNEINLKNLVHNRIKSISFKKGTIAIGFVPIDKKDDKWLMTGIVNVIKDAGKGKVAGAKYRDEKFNFRIVVRYHKNSQNGIRKASDLINELEVLEIWNPNKSLDDKKFPDYRNVNVSYEELKKKLTFSEDWKTALKCRRGVYLIADKKTGKLYVGSAYGKNGILGRWETYLKNGYDKTEKENNEYPNKKFRELISKNGMIYVKENFQYSILETFTEDTTDDEIIKRESFWKEKLLSREFGYNAN